MLRQNSYTRSDDDIAGNNTELLKEQEFWHKNSDLDFLESVSVSERNVATTHRP